MLTDRLADIAAYCKVDADDAELPGFVDAAAAYLSGAGVSEPEDGTARFAQYLRCVIVCFHKTSCIAVETN